MSTVDFMEMQTDGSWKMITATFTPAPPVQVEHKTSKSACIPHLDPRMTLSDIRRYCDTKGIKVTFAAKDDFIFKKA